MDMNNNIDSIYVMINKFIDNEKFIKHSPTLKH